MTVEILPPLPGSGKGKVNKQNLGGTPGGFASSRFTVLRIPPLLAAVLMIPLLLILLPLQLLASLFFGFRLWRRIAMLPRLRR